MLETIEHAVSLLACFFGSTLHRPWLLHSRCCSLRPSQPLVNIGSSSRGSLTPTDAPDALMLHTCVNVRFWPEADLECDTSCQR